MGAMGVASDAEQGELPIDTFAEWFDVQETICRWAERRSWVVVHGVVAGPSPPGLSTERPVASRLIRVSGPLKRLAMGIEIPKLTLSRTRCQTRLADPQSQLQMEGRSNK